MNRKPAADARREHWRIVTLALDFIEESSEEEQRFLLADLSSAAWPTPTAQAQ